MKPISLIITLLFTITMVFAQSPLTHEKKIYRDAKGDLYVNKSLPVYLSISTSEGGETHQLKGKDETHSPMYLDSEGYNTIRSPWKVNPKTGETIYPKEEVVWELYADSQAPASKATLSTEKVVSEGGKKLVKEGTITITSQDATSGINQIFYSIDGSDFKPYANAITLSEEKEYLIKYYAVDNVGNAEEVKELAVVLDKTAPVSSLSVEGDQVETTVAASASLVIASNDSSTGVDKIFYTIDEGKTYLYSKAIPVEGLAEGTHTISYFAVDKVNNNEEKKEFTFFVDKSAPRVIEEIIGNTFITNGKEYYSGRTKLKFVALDNKAGIKDIQYSINGGPYVLYEEPFYLTQSGSLNIKVKATDKVNNSITKSAFSDSNNMLNYVDLAGPELSFSLTGPSFNTKDTIFIAENTKIGLKGADAESGFKELDYQITGGALESYSEPFSIKEEGQYTITYYGYDNLSNSSTESILCVVDNTGPEVFNRFSLQSKSKEIDGKVMEVFPPHVVLFLSATDKHTGLEKITYKINGSQELAYNGLIKNFKSNTLYNVEVLVEDHLGNQNIEEIKFYVE